MAEDTEKAPLQGLPRQMAVAIGARAAMRALPALAVKGRKAKSFGHWPQRHRRRHLLSVLRGYQTFHVRATADERAAANAAYDAEVAADDAVVAARDTTAARAGDAARAAAACAAYPLDADAAYAAAAAAFAATPISARPAFGAALEDDVQFARFMSPSDNPVALLQRPLWPAGMPRVLERLWIKFQEQANQLDAGFDVWIEWYRDRLDGGTLDLEAERAWAALSKERLSQEPREINTYLQNLLKGGQLEDFRRVRAIFIGHGGTGKSSLIAALHEEDIVEGQGEMTRGVDIRDAAAVLRRLKDFPEKGLAVHFWDFGGQVMAHATHQFFLRARCLYVIVLDGRVERNANEEAEYWLAHVRAFGDNAPVLLVGNKMDQATVSIDLRMLKQKYSNIVGFYPISCTHAKTDRRAEFEVFERDFEQALLSLVQQSERFTRPQFKVLEEIRRESERDDFLPHERFAQICADAEVPTEGPASQASLLDLFDKLGIVIHFPNLPYLSEFVLNPQWLTYGVYTIMYSERARTLKGRICAQDVVEIFKKTTLKDAKERGLRYPPDRCQTIVDAMVAFRIAYRLAHDPDGLVIPALLEANQPEHDFDATGALFFRFAFQGFLPRHVVPTVIVDRHKEIDRSRGEEVVWQNGVLLKARRGLDARAMITADYHDRHIDLQATGMDASRFLGILRDSIRSTLDTMPELPFQEMVQLRPDMRVDREQSRTLSDSPVWIPSPFIETTLKNRQRTLPGPDGFMYDVEKIVHVVPLPRDLQAAEVFLSYSKQDRATIDRLAEAIEGGGFSVWFDRDLMAGDRFRRVIAERIRFAKVVVVLWTKHSVGSKWVVDEASRASDRGKLICLREESLPPRDIPPPFSSNNHVLTVDQSDELLEALSRRCRPT